MINMTIPIMMSNGISTIFKIIPVNDKQSRKVNSSFATEGRRRPQTGHFWRPGGSWALHLGQYTTMSEYATQDNPW